MLAPKRVFVLLINAGTANEGIHSLQIGDRNKVLMFESEDDATRYALMLEAQDFPAPSVEGFPAEEIEEFCQEAGYEAELVSTGELTLPPESNVEEPLWNGEEGSSPPASPSPESTENADLSEDELEAKRRWLEGLL
ncbi:DUF3110 domain-containing protein [Spirulina sp. CS-785/01]|uniref:DUF3110 domain-containing protein n=1 Tax=Spirulina sp. CS-785/01 TaxID=3021716 RepID=UPI00232ECBD1|nr:DUF3110 domain-containing protein [Spirulina sp. CS-785/01]MDB9313411.1 DUF3110 domain-containing protein [Spirulina sp. CS-785/01]